jgi:hypothetical protein
MVGPASGTVKDYQTPGCSIPTTVMFVKFKLTSGSPEGARPCCTVSALEELKQPTSDFQQSFDAPCLVGDAHILRRMEYVFRYYVTVISI